MAKGNIVYEKDHPPGTTGRIICFGNPQAHASRLAERQEREAQQEADRMTRAACQAERSAARDAYLSALSAGIAQAEARAHETPRQMVARLRAERQEDQAKRQKSFDKTIELIESGQLERI